jgi:hypothetical protein
MVQSPPISRRKIGSIDPGVCPESTETKSQDGGRNGHLGWAAELIIERNLPLVTPNEPHKNLINQPRHLSSNQRKPNPRWQPSWVSGGADHRTLVTPNKPQKNRINRPRRLSHNWWKPTVYGHRRIGHDIMPQTFYDRGINICHVCDY